jgi:hypothetical protein
MVGVYDGAPVLGHAGDGKPARGRQPAELARRKNPPGGVGEAPSEGWTGEECAVGQLLMKVLVGVLAAALEALAIRVFRELVTR